MQNTVTDIKGIKVGSFSDRQARTGCTVVLSEQGFLGSCEVRGGAPGTREKALLEPNAGMDQVHGILLTGGSAFGLRAAAGVMDYLEEKEIGYPTGVARVPIIPAGVIFDLARGDSEVRPDADMAYQACCRAVDENIETGDCGVALGATVGKIRGMENCMSTGLGTASMRQGKVIAGALAVCNALGDIRDPHSHEILAGAKKDDGSFVDSKQALISGLSVTDTDKEQPGAKMTNNTTLVVVAVNAQLNKTEVHKISQMAHNGLAQTIFPVHTMLDGDIVFTLAGGEIKGVDVSALGTMVTEVVSRAIVNCVLKK